MKSKVHYIARLAGILAALLIFMGVVYVLDYLYVDPGGTLHVLWHQFYEDRGKIDNIYLGSSHVFQDINPMLLDELNGQYNFDLSSPEQVLNGSYFLLKEADRTNTLSHVYLELFCSSHSSGTVDPLENEYFYARNWGNTDFMELSPIKLEYALSIAGPEKYTEIFLPFTRYRDKLDDWEYIKHVMEAKQSDDYLSYKGEHLGDDVEYNERQGQGYVYSTIIFKDIQRRGTFSRMDEKPIGEKSEQYLRKIIRYCQDRDIEIILFMSPVDGLYLTGVENYDNLVKQIKEIAGEYHIPFYDFNLAKEEYLPLNKSEHFCDSAHLNHEGADIFTPFFHEVVSASVSDNEEKFYDTYVEKQKNSAPDVYGIIYMNTEFVEETHRYSRYQIASNKNSGIEYRIIITPDEGEQYMVQDFTENKEFAIRTREHGTCTIVSRIKDTPDVVQTLEIDY